MAIETKCPICGEMVNNYFCENCGFEIHILPADISDEVKAYEQGRVAKYKETRQKLVSSEEKCEKLSSQLKKAQKESEKEINAKDGRIQNLEQDKEKLQATLVDKESEIKQLTSDGEKIRSQLLSMKKQMEELSKNAEKAHLEGVVNVIQTDSYGNVLIERFLPIYEGRNTYGTAANGQPEHHVITLRRTPIQGEHFSVEKNNKGQMIVKPIGKAFITCDGVAIPEKGNAVEISHKIKIGNSVEIKIAKF